MRRISECEDEKVLKYLIKDNDLNIEEKSEELKLLWECCQIPDFVKKTYGNHLEVVGKVFNFLRESPGKITNFHAPGGHGVRIDTHVYANYKIPPNYDSMIAKLITVAQTRDEAIRKMQRALDEFVIDGIKTTIPFHKKLMKNENFIKGNYTTKFLDDFSI